MKPFVKSKPGCPNDESLSSLRIVASGATTASSFSRTIRHRKPATRAGVAASIISRRHRATISSRDRREVKAAYDRGYQTAYRALTGRLGISGTRLICNQITPPTVAMIAAGLGFSGDQVVVTGDGTGHLGVSDAVVGLQQLQRRGEIDGPIVVGASTAYAFGTGMLVPPDHG